MGTTDLDIQMAWAFASYMPPTELTGRPPTALPRFAAGVGVLGLFGWRTKREYCTLAIKRAADYPRCRVKRDVQTIRKAIKAVAAAFVATIASCGSGNATVYDWTFSGEALCGGGTGCAVHEVAGPPVRVFIRIPGL
jgi:hypothetical protein